MRPDQQVRQGQQGTQMRRYEDTHPWITFDHRLDFSAKLWMQIGEVQSKCEHIAGTPLQPAVQDDLYAIYLSKGAHATTQIEGNTLSEDEVRLIVNRELKLPPSQEYLAQEVDNVLSAFEIVLRDVADAKPLTITPERIYQINEAVLQGMDTQDHVTPGKIRTDSVTVGGGIYRGAPAEDCEFLVRKLCDWLAKQEQHAVDADLEHRFALRLVSAILAHLYLAWIHPFGDGNGRTARMVEFQLLNLAGVPAIAAHLLSDHYNRTRTKYLEVLREASTRRPYSVEPFIQYAVQGLVDGMRTQIDKIRTQHMFVTWHNFIYERFQHSTGDTARRRKLVALSLLPGKWTPSAEIRHLTPEIAEAYAGLTAKTVSRDLNALQNLGLITRTRTGVAPAIDQLRSFIPLRANRTEQRAAR
ncbi:Fic family protein [Streptomyces sp. NPDC088353]|uniref:Fic family protein n=1 Tax=unclassified Streptomyces TaxID=2593676 RepID=UPI0036C61A34